MRQIVFVIGHYKNGGVPMRATNLANEFGRQGYQVTILVTKEIGVEVFFQLHSNVRLVSLAQFVKDHETNSLVIKDRCKRERKIRFYKLLRYLTRKGSKLDEMLEQRVRQIMKGNKFRTYMLLYPDVTVIPFGLSYYEEAFCAIEGLRCKIIYAERNAPELEVPKDKKRAKQILALLRKANGAVFQTADEAKYYKPYIDQNTAIIHNPIKANLPKPYDGERRKVIVNFCRVSPQKNLYLLIEAFAKLQKEFSEYLLQIYGNAVENSEEVLKEELQEYVQKIGLQDYIHILPPAADVHNKVRDCAMFVSSSDFEGLSNSMIEAMAIGLPSVCTDCLGGGAKEIIEHEENGLLVPMQDVEMLYQGMKRFITDQALAEKCGKNAAKLREELSVQKIAKQWLQVIDGVVR